MVFKSPKAMILEIAPKAKCTRDWSRGGYRIDFGQEVKGFNGEILTAIHSSTRYPSDAWAAAVFLIGEKS